MHSDILKIEVLYNPKCRNWPQILKLLEKALKELGLSFQISTREVKTIQEAEKLAFWGSPTVKINGEDLEPKASGKPVLT